MQCHILAEKWIQPIHVPSGLATGLLAGVACFMLSNPRVWLPNDPRGSWSDTVYQWELLQYGRPTHSIARKSLVQLKTTGLAPAS